ncbi:hypothetical protein PPTG_23216 [Phytophthora nicotianae INRA-310]|uniref:Uncharacterized protein n=1 Tax=Phytophthora nicotianae (strain INRA-310) TaxID=761204 RepID=W2Q2F4_PHYN3|nr:hypothetical protein PPTG_23216 [Phytophthora nicotianae INRA-310]ETN07061.1 hypothetical protein PPTG_23216 [Phytophthora nicotianae INRA-310]
MTSLAESYMISSHSSTPSSSEATAAPPSEVPAGLSFGGRNLQSTDATIFSLKSLIGDRFVLLLGVAPSSPINSRQCCLYHSIMGYKSFNGASCVQKYRSFRYSNWTVEDIADSSLRRTNCASTLPR